jgi:hypothetical protein
LVGKASLFLLHCATGKLSVPKAMHRDNGATVFTAHLLFTWLVP